MTTRFSVSDKPAASGKHDFTVHMYYRGQCIGRALVRGVYGSRTARAVALRGIATSIVPMTDRDLAQWRMHQPGSQEFDP